MNAFWAWYHRSDQVVNSVWPRGRASPTATGKKRVEEEKGDVHLFPAVRPAGLLPPRRGLGPVGQLDPGWGVVAGLLPAADVAVDAGGGEPARQAGAEQE